MPTVSPSARTLLRQHLIENFSQGELEELAFDLGLDAETLLRETKSEFARALILYFEDRDEIERLAHEALARRPDPGLEQNLRNIEAEATIPPSSAPIFTPQTPRSQSVASRLWQVIPIVVAVGALAGLLALLASRRPNGNDTSSAKPPPVMTASLTAALSLGIANDVPGTLLELNETVRSGLDNTSKPRDVWRVRLQAQQPYKIEVQSSVQDGIGLGLLQPGTSRAPDTQETADINVCSYASSCPYVFVPPLAGDYYIVVYGLRPLVGYNLTVRDR